MVPLINSFGTYKDLLGSSLIAVVVAGRKLLAIATLDSGILLKQHSVDEGIAHVDVEVNCRL